MVNFVLIIKQIRFGFVDKLDGNLVSRNLMNAKTNNNLKKTCAIILFRFEIWLYGRLEGLLHY